MRSVAGLGYCPAGVTCQRWWGEHLPTRVRDDVRVQSPDASGRYQPLATPTPVNSRPEQARWADTMKEALGHRRMSLPALTAAVAGQLGLAPTTDKIRRWLANDTAVDPHAIPVLARAVGVHSLEMLAAFGLVEDSLAGMARRLAATEQRVRRQRALLQRQDRDVGGALFAELALRQGNWAVTVVPHWRGRSCRYHVGDYVLLERRDGIATRADAERVFAEAFERTGATWDDVPFATEPVPRWPAGRLFVPRLAAPRAAEPHAGDVPGVHGIVLTGPMWAGMYTVAALVSAALGWGLDSFALLARSLSSGGQLDKRLADELMRDALARPDGSPHQVWAHVLTQEPAPMTPAARLLGSPPEDVRVVLLVPDDDMLGVVADLGGKPCAQARIFTAGWRALLPEGPRIWQVPVSAPVGRDGTPLAPTETEFLDAYHDTSVTAALRVLAMLAAPRRLADIVPMRARGNAFAALAATYSAAAPDCPIGLGTLANFSTSSRSRTSSIIKASRSSNISDG